LRKQEKPYSPPWAGCLDLWKSRRIFEPPVGSVSRSPGTRSGFLFFMVHLHLGHDGRADAAGGEPAGYARIERRPFTSLVARIKRRGPGSSDSSLVNSWVMLVQL
jgi:hypothetical protein